MALRLLLVSEHTENASFIKRTLKATDLELAGETAMGAEAVVAARETRPDAILIGVEEPQARALRTIESLRLAAAEYPIIAVSSMGDREALRKAMVAGARDYLVRPFGPDDLRQAIINLLEAEQRRASLSDDAKGRSGNPGEIVAVFGGKGGVGRSTLAANLAVSLAKETHQRVALVDLDTQLGDVALLMNLEPERTLADLLPYIDRLDSDLLRDFLAVHESGVRVLPAPMRPEDGETVSGAAVQRLLDVMMKTYDYVVLDLPRSFNEAALTALDAAALVLLVATPDIACLKNTKLCLGMMRMWHYPPEKLKLVINHTGGAAVGGREVEEAVEYPIFWKIPHSNAVAQAARRGQPVVLANPGSSTARNVQRLARVVSGTYRPPTGLFARLLARV